MQPAKFVCEELFPTRRLRQPGDRHDVLLPLEPGQAFSRISYFNNSNSSNSLSVIAEQASDFVA